VKEIHSRIQVDAPSERVWGVLIDFQNYRRWNPFIYDITGEARIGEKIRISLRTPGGRERTYEPLITRVESGRELRWVGKSLFLAGEHIFSLESLNSDSTLFVQKEVFKGLLSSFFGEDTDKDIAGGFEQMNQALKRRVERKSN
jgi:hypothetical protein